MTLTLGEQLGRTGGYASVFRAQQTADGRTITIAVKVYLEHRQNSIDAELTALNAVGRGGHSNVLECLGEDTLEPAQVPPPSSRGYSHVRRCLKLSLCDPRGDLFHIAFRGSTPLTIADVQGFAQQMVDGVKHIHSQGYAHLDIKPDNMLVDADGTLKISDYGLAMRMPIVGCDPRGTTGFAAPELTNRDTLGLTDDVDWYKVDVWALAVTILFLSIRSNPFAQLDYRHVGGTVETRDDYKIRRRDLYHKMRDWQATWEAVLWPANPRAVDPVYGACGTIRGLAARFHTLPPYLKTLLNGMLYLDQARRPTIHEVAAFPWITGAVPAPADPATEPPPPGPPSGPPTIPPSAPGATSASSAAYRGLGAAVPDEAEEPRYNACGASALDDVDDLAIPPPVQVNAGTLILD